MNFVLIISYSAIFIHNINWVKTSFCDESNYWCYKSGLRIKSGLIQLNQTEYTSCIQYCEENMICKGFEYDINQQTCRFASFPCFLRGNVDQHDLHELEVYWKKMPNVSCSKEIHEGK